MADLNNYKEMNSYAEGTYIMPNKIENVYCRNMDTTPNFGDKYYDTEYVFPNNMTMPVWNNYNMNIPNYNSAAQISEELMPNQLYSTMDDPSARNTNYGTLNVRLCNKDRVFYANNERDGNVHENNVIRYPRFDMNAAPRVNRRSDFPRNTCHARRNLRRNIMHERYNRIRREAPFNMDMYGKNQNRNYSCNCLYIYRNIYKNRYDVVDMKQVHTELIYLIIKYLYYERILPEANEIKRKINKYFPDCPILNNNFINICREDILNIFDIYKANSQEKEDKKSKNYYKKTYNNENICIYLRGIPRDYFINPNDDNENISSYIPLIFIHIIDRFRLQSNDNNHKGGRYILAETLKHTGPYIFRTMKLGRIIHILQKCIDLNILSYFNNNIIPIFTSMSISKTYVSKLHVNETPALKNHQENSINLIKSRISYLLYSFSEDKTKSKGSFSLSRLPLIYKNVYKENINIDQIGYSKLTEFINNEMSDICYISTQHKFQCILLPVMEDEQKHRDKNAKLRKETELKKSLDYIKNYRWERCISYLHYSNCLKDKNIEFELEYNYCNPTLEELKKDMHFYDEEDDNEEESTQNDNPNDKTDDVPLLLPLDVFNLPSTYDMYDSYYKSSTYYSKDEKEDKAKIKFPDNSQNKFDIMCDFKKCENTNISVEESINLNHMYYNFPSSYYVFNYLFNDYVEDLSVVDQIRIQ
ncbi:hypothetical protein PFAG_05471 [Plasmodium falciparum Santa Lucia]|uniref:HTH OST-type domain-containing protein n=9 Tax=Plasmodium falciparum TaxID=5833 RepID=W4IVM2_PLAFP|nr:hypothetical protein PFFVO_05011 [Plasmodium falciparum Vietnam Oak-Knoll (FVO)]ETW29135.1 hypothetical protein PFFCH_03439 [Plasmodium falciparum FCH/4]ETW33903.1 hypothetical protein PFTANZ_05357 [Plasmodium falciparum Tanzania (2000708)]ETW54035.1 hypothetical protein PFUGPA_03907 [Plasmodium falciparum Palo Alto/Uganda]ETW58342.1 hypothetical protein PFMC_05445 [Plasmodium falciparum CAMP/Malaysia]EUR62834.1 hypothetical protein PFBG_05440 [Plasmodium falciparum 7G8]EUT78894.1 hypothet